MADPTPSASSSVDVAVDGGPEPPEHSSSLTIWIVAAIIAAVVVSLVLPALPGLNWVEAAGEQTRIYASDGVDLSDTPPADAPTSWKQSLVEGVFALGGEVFLNILFMLVVPLVVTSVMAGILSLGDVRKLGRPGLYAILYYFATTVLAVTVGLLLANLFRPGLTADGVSAGAATVESAELDSRMERAEAEDAPQTVGGILKGLIETIFTKNLFVSAAEQQLLPLILFSIVFAALLTTRQAATETLRRLIVEAADTLMAFVMLVMKIAPLGIFCLVAGRFGEAALKGEFVEKLQELGWYFATVTVGLMVHALVTLPLIFWLVRGSNPYAFLGKMSQALLTAFGTSSSSATLPVTIETATQNAGVSKKAAGFVLPLGATVNMDGTALYEATAALYIAQLAGLDLGLGQQIVIAVTATLAAIGAAGVPEAGLVTMLIVLKAVGLSEKYVATILPIDWLLDRIRTTVNVFGDATGAAILTPQLPDPTGDPAASPTVGDLATAQAAASDEPQPTVVLGQPALGGLSTAPTDPPPASDEPADTVVMQPPQLPPEAP